MGHGNGVLMGNGRKWEANRRFHGASGCAGSRYRTLLLLPLTTLKYIVNKKLVVPVRNKSCLFKWKKQGIVGLLALENIVFGGKQGIFVSRFGIQRHFIDKL